MENTRIIRLPRTILNFFAPLATCVALMSSWAVAGQSGPIASLTVSQAVRVETGRYVAVDAITIAFQLDRPAEVTVIIGRHSASALSARMSGQGPVDTQVLPDPPVVRQLHLGRLEAGRHEATWDGLDAQSQPVTEKTTDIYRRLYKWLEYRTKDPQKAHQPVTAEELVHRLPVDLFRITLRAGDQEVSTNFQRVRGVVASWPRVAGVILDGRQLPGGEFIAMDRNAWLGYHLGPDLNVIRCYPTVKADFSANQPVESDTIRADSKGMVYASSNGSGRVMKYNADGTDGKWQFVAPYIHRMSLGVRVQSRLKPGETSFFGSGGKTVYYNAAKAEELVKQPGFAYSYGGMAIGPDDYLYLVKTDPAPAAILVFKPSGEYLRAIALPEKEFHSASGARTIRFGRDGKLWLGPGKMCRLDLATERIDARIVWNAQGFTLDSEGNLLAWNNQGRIARFTPNGEPLPFTAESPYRVKNPEATLNGKRSRSPKQGPGIGFQAGELDFLRPEKQTREEDPTRGRAGVLCVLPGNTGDFCVLTCDDIVHFQDFPTSPQAAIHLDRQGRVVPQLLDVTWGQARPGNVFVDAEPARLELYVTNLTDGASTLEAKWTITDLDGNAVTGAATRTVAGRRRQAFELPLEMPVPGAYEVACEIRQGQRLALGFSLVRRGSARARWKPRSIRPSAFVGGQTTISAASPV